MSPEEIAYRLRYGCQTAFERWAHRRGRLAPPDRLQTALSADVRETTDWKQTLLARSAMRRFFAWQDDPEAIRELFRTAYLPELVHARKVAADAAQHEVSFFGRRFRFGPEVDWHADPMTGAEWPRRYHRDVPVHAGNVGFGDVKYVWELNRHQFLIDLAKVAFLDRSPRHASAVHALLSSWHLSVPYATGVPWACALEPAFRVWSWMWTYFLLHNADFLPDEVHLEWLTGFYDHGRFLHRHLERYSSPYNHLIGEASALFALGVLFPEFAESTAWVRRSRSILESTVDAQFHSDGGTVEQSTFYHHATVGFYLLAAILGRRNGIDLSPQVWGAIERAMQFSMSLMQPNGCMPQIGGADDGKPIRLEHLPLWDFRPYQAIGAVVFLRPDFKFAARRFWEDALWLLGSEGFAAYERLNPREPARTAALPATGYYVVRSDWSADADYVCFDCGEQAAGLRRDNVPSAAHGHADCLAVVITLGGRPVLVDPGFFCYNGDPDWEVHFRKTRAHNTLAVDGADQARHVSKMVWTHTYAARPEGWNGNAKLAWARGSHDGYTRTPDGVVHRRTVWLRDAGYVVIYDELVGDGHHSVQANYQFAPGTMSADGTCGALFDDRFEVAWACSVDVTSKITTGHPGPSGGWVAPGLGVREPAPRLTLEFVFNQPRVALLTVLADRWRADRSNKRVRVSFEPASLLVASIRTADGEDQIMASDGSPVTWGGIETDVELGVIERRNGAAVTSRIGGNYLRIQGRRSSSSGEPDGRAAEPVRIGM